MALGPNAITQLSKLVTGIPAVLRKLPTIAKDPIRMFGELASAKVIAKLEKQATDVADAGLKGTQVPIITLGVYRRLGGIGIATNIPIRQHNRCV